MQRGSGGDCPDPRAGNDTYSPPDTAGRKSGTLRDTLALRWECIPVRSADARIPPPAEVDQTKNATTQTHQY